MSFDANIYLQRLGINSKSPSLDFLNEIIHAHQRTISFNNLAVFFNRDQLLNLELEPLFEKVVYRGEGGYCFENNKVFFYLLKELGFSVEPRAARVILNKTGDIPRTHRLTLVTLEEKRFLADVGFGRHAPTQAVQLEAAPRLGFHVPMIKGQYSLTQIKDGQEIPLYVFDEGTHQESDFMVANHFTNTHPSSLFRRELMISRVDGDVTELIHNKTYSRIVKDVRDDVAITSQSEFQNYLLRFGITGEYDFSKLA